MRWAAKGRAEVDQTTPLSPPALPLSFCSHHLLSTARLFCPHTPFPDSAHVELEVSRECLLFVPGSETVPMTMALFGLLDKVAGKLSFEHQWSIRTTFLYRDHEKDLQRCQRPREQRAETQVIR